jgi:hypothetical protein
MLTTNTKLLAILIGVLGEEFLELKTKEDVDLAGLSLPQVLCNHGPWLKEKEVSIFQNNNLLIAQDHKEIKDAMEDGHQVLLNTLQQAELLLNQNILMLVEIKLAKEMVEISVFQGNQASQDVLAWHQELTQNPFQSLLMLLTGDHTEGVF